MLNVRDGEDWLASGSIWRISGIGPLTHPKLWYRRLTVINHQNKVSLKVEPEDE